MANQELIDYIKQQLQAGLSREEIQTALMEQGWREEDIDNAFTAVSHTSDESVPPPPPPQTSTSLPSAFEVLRQAWSIYRQRIGTFAGISLIPMGVTAILFNIFISGYFPLVAYTLYSNFGEGTGLLIILVIVLILGVLHPWAEIALLYAIKDYRENIGVIESYRRGLRKLLSYWWVSLLTALLIVIGFLLVIVPGIIFMVWFSWAIFVMVDEDAKGLKALAKSKAYVRGHWFRAFWYIAFMYTVSFLLVMAVAIVVAFAQIPALSSVGRLLMNILWTPLSFTYLFLAYRHLKALKT